MMMKVGTASIVDRDAVIALWEVCDLTRPWNDPVADFDRALQTPTSAILVGTRDEATVASVMLGFDGHRGWLYYLAVAPEYRGKGYARTLLEYAERQLAELGAPKVELMVRNGNSNAAFYDRVGWEQQPVTVYAKWLKDKI